MAAPWMIVVTGRPGAGKSTLAAWLGQQLRWPVFGKDGIKEILYEQVGTGDLDWSRKLGRASIELLYYMAGVQLAAGRSLILENAFWPELAGPPLRALRKQYNVCTIEIICRTDGEVLIERFRARAEAGQRHAGHADLQVLDELRQRIAEEWPLRLKLGGAVIEVDTTDFSNVHYETILAQVQAIIDGTGRESC